MTGVGHALMSGMSSGWMRRGSGGTSIAALGAKVMRLCQRTVWHGMGPVRGLNRAGPAAKIPSHRAAGGAAEAGLVFWVCAVRSAL